MSISADGKTLIAATKELARHWDETKRVWRDAKSREFEEAYLSELLNAVDRALPILEQLEKITAQIRHDCE